MSTQDPKRVATRLQHHAEDRESQGGSVSPPVHRTSLFTFPDCATFEAAFRGEISRPLYTRVSNPTTRVLEKKIADLEGAGRAIAFGSGMAAISATLLGLLDAGDHLLLQSSAYGPTLAFAIDPLERLGVETTVASAGELEDLEPLIRKETRLIYLESPSSLTFELVDFERIASVARERGIPTALDNSWASPLYQRPLERGIDLVIHSGTKYINGHSDALSGFVAGSGALLSRIKKLAVALGAAPSADEAALVLRGLRTLEIRMERHCRSALELAAYLAEHPLVERVLHPGPGAPEPSPLAERYLSGSSGLFAFTLSRGDPRRFVDALEIFELGVSWGGHESLALPLDCVLDKPGERELRPDVPPRTIRLSVGLEDPGDLRADLERGFSALES